MFASIDNISFWIGIAIASYFWGGLMIVNFIVRDRVTRVSFWEKVLLVLFFPASSCRILYEFIEILIEMMKDNGEPKSMDW